ncbi:MAG: hypothetical protein MUF42_11430 [Cytophagaceae bacterium]|jgi:hypothetical protein|nr:hypothetical protein [Cytophagaceae bacterium]
MPKLTILLFLFLQVIHWDSLAQSFLGKEQENETSQEVLSLGKSDQEKKSDFPEESKADYVYQRCEAGWIEASVNGAKPGEYYIWKVGDRIVKSSNNHQDNTCRIHVHQSTWAEVVISDRKEVQGKLKVFLKVAQNPHPYIISEKSAHVCPGERLTLKAYDGEIFLWQQGVQALNMQQSAVLTEKIYKNTTYKVQAFNKEGCWAFAEIQVQLLETPKAPKVAAYQSRCGKGEITLTTLSKEPNIRWYKDLSSSQYLSDAAEFKVSVLNASTYFVSAVGQNGCESPRFEAITTALSYPVPARPELNLESNYTLCKADSLRIKIQNSNNRFLHWEWSHQGAVIQKNSSSEFHHFYNHSQRIQVRALDTITQCYSEPAYLELTVANLPQPVAKTTAVCQLGKIRFEVDSIPNAQYNWYTQQYDHKPIAYSGGDDFVNRHYLNRTIFETNSDLHASLWCEAVLPSLGCVSKRTKVSVMIHSFQKTSLPTSVHLCADQSKLLEASLSSTEAYSYLWQKWSSTGTSWSNEKALLLIGKETKSDFVQLQLKHIPSGCEWKSNVIPIHVYAQPNAPEIIQEVTCGKTQLSAGQLFEEESLCWRDEFNNIISRAPELVLSNNQLYSYVQVETVNNACRSAVTSVVPTWKALPEVPIIEGGSVCSDITISLQAKGASPGQIYQWYSPEGKKIDKITGPFLRVNSSNANHYSVSVLNQEGCESHRVSPRLLIEPKPSIQGPDHSCPHTSIELKSENTSRSNWYENGRYIGSWSSIYVTPSATTEYTLEDPTKSFACSKTSLVISPSIKYCHEVLSTEETSVQNEISTKLLIHPNPSSDLCSVQWKNASHFAELRIINSMGTILYELTIENETPIETISQLPTGNYYFVIRFPDGNGFSMPFIKSDVLR